MRNMGPEFCVRGCDIALYVCIIYIYIYIYIYITGRPLRRCHECELQLYFCVMHVHTCLQLWGLSFRSGCHDRVTYNFHGPPCNICPGPPQVNFILGPHASFGPDTGKFPLVQAKFCPVLGNVFILIQAIFFAWPRLNLPEPTWALVWVNLVNMETNCWRNDLLLSQEINIGWHTCSSCGYSCSNCCWRLRVALSGTNVLR